MANRIKSATGQRASWITTYDAQAFGNSDVILAAPAALQSILVSSKSDSTLWFQIFDAAAVPDNGAIPTIAPIALAPGSTVRLLLNDSTGDFYDGQQFTNGIAWAASTTAGTLTIDDTASAWVTARYLA